MSQGEEHAAGTLQDGRSRTSGDRRPPPQRPDNVPLGFRDFRHFQEFATHFRHRMRERYPDLDMAFQGSAVTGRSAESGASFDEGRVSDFDIAITGDSVNEAARAGGVPFRGDGVSTGPLSERDLDRLGLDDIVDDASANAGRDIHIMIFRTMDDAVGRRPTIRVWF